jgi:DNA ligase (NAD+)
MAGMRERVIYLSHLLSLLKDLAMYSSEQTRKLQLTSNDLLKKTGAASAPSINIDVLREVLRFHEYRYYIMNEPLISDSEYDQLYKYLEKVEKENPSLVTQSSPTQRVAKGLTKDFATVQHLVPMLSLENSYNSDDLVDWDRKAKEASGL